MHAPRGGRDGGGTLKGYKNVQGEGGRGQAYVRYKKTANSFGDLSPNTTKIKQVSNALISCLASSTHLLAGFKSMTCKLALSMDEW